MLSRWPRCGAASGVCSVESPPGDVGVADAAPLRSGASVVTRDTFRFSILAIIVIVSPAVSPLTLMLGQRKGKC